MFLARFLVPLVPLVLMLAADTLGQFEAGRRGRVRAAWILLVLLQLWPIARLEELHASQRFYEQRWIAIGKELAARAPPWKLATSPIGAIGWYSRLPIVDLLGITNDALRQVEPDLAITLKGHQRHDARWVLAQQPDAIVLGNGVSPRGEKSLEVNAWERELYLDPQFQAEYEAQLLPIPGSRSLIYFQRRTGNAPAGSTSRSRSRSISRRTSRTAASTSCASCRASSRRTRRTSGATTSPGGSWIRRPSMP